MRGRITLWLAFLAGVQVIAASTDLADLLPGPVARWVQLIVGALGAGTIAYLKLTSPGEPSTFQSRDWQGYYEGSSPP
jgi:hypothetical protein